MFIPPTTPIGILPGDHDPIYVNLHSTDRSQQIINSSTHQGHIQNPGVILTDDTIKIPLPMLTWINNNKSVESRIVMGLLFRSIDTQGERKKASPNELYEQLRNGLPKELHAFLNKDELLSFSRRDPDLIAFDESLKFASFLLSLLSGLGEEEPISSERAEAGIVNFRGLPDEVKENIVVFCSLINQELQVYLEKIGPNQVGFDILLNASNQIKDALTALKTK